MWRGNQKEWSTDSGYNIDEPQKYAKGKNPVTKDHILYAFIDVKRPERASLWDTKNRFLAT